MSQAGSRSEKAMSSRLLTMKFMQRAAAANAAKESKESSQSPSADDSHLRTPKRQRTSTDAQPSTSATPASSELEAISAAVAAEEDKRREAVSRQAAEAGESEWVLDFPGGFYETGNQYPQQPFVVATGSLDDEGDLTNGGRQAYGNFKRTEKVNTWIDNPHGEEGEQVDHDSKARERKQKSQQNLKKGHSISGVGSTVSQSSQSGKSQKKRKHW